MSAIIVHAVTIGEILLWAKEKLDQSRVAGGWRDARLLLAKVLDVGSEYIVAHPEASVTREQADLFICYVERRSRYEPVSRILGRREFWSLSFRISPATLDPRPDSEALIESVLKDYPDRGASLTILDLGTGSGCLLLTLLKEYPCAFGVGVDISFEALSTARENASDLRVTDRAFFAQGCWGEGFKGPFDLVISNPPYIPDAEIRALDPEVRLYDPLRALDGGEEGVECYRILGVQFRAFIHDHARIYLEIGQGQEKAVEKIMHNAGYFCVAWHRDLAGIKRCGVFTTHQFLDGS